MTEHTPVTAAGPGPPHEVLVAGGGVAALETVLALRELAGDRVRVTVLCSAPDYVDRPMSVREPFAYGPARHYPLATLVGDMGARLVVDTLAWVDPVERVAHTAAGQQLRYDSLVLAVGAQIQKPFPHASTIDDRVLDDLLHGLVQDIEGGYVHRVAFVAPARMGWPLPLYELALMMAERAYDMSATVAITLVIPESEPLAAFGPGASTAIRGLLQDAGITLITETHAKVPSSREVVLGPGRATLEVDRIIALPELFGPAIRGVPGGAHGFIPIDPHCRVVGSPGLFAIGDAADYPIKHGGVASQQAVTAAQVIAQHAGADVVPRPLRPEIHGMLMTGGAPWYLSARVAESGGFASTVERSPGWSPATKIAARYLAPFLRAHDPKASGLRPGPP